MMFASVPDAAALRSSRSGTGDASGISLNASGTCPHFGHERAEVDPVVMAGPLI